MDEKTETTAMGQIIQIDEARIGDYPGAPMRDSKIGKDRTQAGNKEVGMLFLPQRVRWCHRSFAMIVTG